VNGEDHLAEGEPEARSDAEVQKGSVMETLTAPGQSTSASIRLRQVMRKHPLFCFFLLAYAGSWLISTPSLLSVWGVLQGDYTSVFILKPFVGPTLAALIMTGIIEGKAGLRRLRKRLRQRRADWRWYLCVLVGIPALLLLGIIVQPGTFANVHGLTPVLFVSYPVYLFVVFFGVALPEEIGWRGFALPRLQPRYGPLWGTLLLGILWACWHLPYFLTPDHGGGPGSSWATVLTTFVLFLLFVLALAIIFTWVFNHTRGSIFFANVLHASIDTPQLVWVPLFVGVGETSLNLAGLIGFGVPALLIVILTRGRLGYQPSQDSNGGAQEGHQADTQVGTAEPPLLVHTS
jgi:membrane protease YdiL (CAAX protease family)